LQETDVVRDDWIDEARRLLVVDCLVKVVVKKGVLHVQLMDRPGARDNDAENSPDGGWFDNRAERLVVVDAVTLRETTDDPPGLMTSQGAVSTKFVLEDPLAGDDDGTRRSRNETPGAIVDERLVLFNHRRAPILIGERGARVGVDVKSAPHTKHTASRTSWLNTRCRIRSVPVNFP
jgi:hypothetical protein